MAVLRPLLTASDFLQGLDLFRVCMPGKGVKSLENSFPDEKELTSVSRLASLARTIETEIVPRLMLAHRAEFVRANEAIDDGEEADATISQDDVVAFARIVVRKEVADAHFFIDGLQSRGISLESLFLELMAPAARYLGDLWVEDRCDFTEVTLGLSRMQQLLNALSPEFEAGGSGEALDQRALMVTFPGEDHTFGMYMVAEFFRRGGWEVWGGPPDSEEAVYDLIADDWFDLLGVSVSLDSNLDNLRRLIAHARNVSRNGEIQVMVGGRALGGDYQKALSLGADAMATDGRLAFLRAQELLSGIGRRPY